MRFSYTFSMSTPTFHSFKEFWPFYLSQHLDRTCRILHYIGTSAGVTAATYFALTGHYALIPLGFLPAYAMAWIGHFIFEKNRPATFKYPRWSFIGDFVMLYYFVTGKVKAEMAKPEVQNFARS